MNFHPFVLLNGRLAGAREASVSPLSDGFMQGRGLFETIKILRRQPVFFSDHAARLIRSAGRLGLPVPSTAETLRDRCEHLIAANELDDGVLKIVLFQDVEETGELIVARRNPYLPDAYARGFKLTVVYVGQRPGYPGLKTLNYLGNSEAKRAAQAAGFDEPVFADSAGIVLEGATTNVFAVRRGTVVTPELDRGILPGVARANVLRLAGGAPVREGPLTLAQLLEADEVFVTNAVLGVMPVAQIDRRAFRLAESPVTRAILQAYQAAELASIAS